MTAIWTTPRVWSIGEAVDDLKMQDISNNFDWLRARFYDRNVMVNTGGNIVQAVTGAGNWFAVNDALLGVPITTNINNQRIMITFQGLWSTGGAVGSALWWDVLIGTIWGSTGTTTASTGCGLRSTASAAAAATVQEFFFSVVLVIPVAGTYTIVPRIGGSNATTVTLYASVINHILDFTVLDI